MTETRRAELLATKADFESKIKGLEDALASPFASSSISAGGGSKSTSYASGIEARIRYFRRQIQLIDAVLGVAPAPGSPVDVQVRFDA